MPHPYVQDVCRNIGENLICVMICPATRKLILYVFLQWGFCRLTRLAGK